MSNQMINGVDREHVELLQHQSNYSWLVTGILELDPEDPVSEKEFYALYKDLRSMSDKLVDNFEENEFEDVQSLEGLGIKLMVTRFLDFLKLAKFNKPADAGCASGTIVSIHKNIVRKWEPFYPSWAAKLEYQKAKRDGYLVNHHRIAHNR